jgi:hypothetical protein
MFQIYCISYIERYRRQTLDSYCVRNCIISSPFPGSLCHQQVFGRLHSPASVRTPASVYTLRHRVFNVVMYESHIHF